MELFSNSVVRLQNVVLIVNATASAVAPMQCLSLVGALSNMTLTALNSDVIATCGRGLKLITVPTYDGADGVRVLVAGGTLQSVLTMTDVSLTSKAQFSVPGVVIVQFHNITEATNTDITVSNFSLTTTVDYRSLSKPLLAPTTVGAIGTHGAVLLSQSAVSHCVVTLSNVEMSFEEMGAISISPYLQGFSVTALFYGVVVFYGYTSEFATVVISNSSLMLTQQDPTLAAAAISPSPTILAGVVVRSASVILVFAALRNGHLMVTNCTIASTAVVFSTAKATPVWNGVGIIYHASVGSFLQADQPQIVPYLSAILPDAFFSTINDSDIHIDTCTVTGPVLSATIIATIPPSIFRLSVAIVNFFNMHNTTTTIVASSSSSSSPSLASTASQELRECVCLAAVSLVPSSTISNSRIALWNYLHFQHCNTSHSGNTSSFISLR
ncbi:Hypothetical protein, putative [Bodo saltans]|uniref:Uncharacterized protein n=1 Tax=Bodo saltans TaxID=75058 RepID=A0A0S4JDV4_BODSA|nr:Hypothetical protein, putative [Bodo saltans]|eukprot:CUG88348.1 Hypothetical protein, putative [Bodo saltans]